MKTKTLAITALLAIGLAAIGSSARAALTYTPGDLFLGFRALGGTGSDKTYVLNIGQFSLYTTGSSFTIGTIGADLVSAFGASWNTDRGEGNNVQWGVVGTSYNTGSDPKTIFVSKPSSVETEFTGKASSGSLQTIGFIQNIASGYLNSAANGANAKGTIQGVGDPNSWNSAFEGTLLDLNRFDEIEGNFVSGTGAPDAILNLYQINAVNGSAAILLGTISIDTAGVVTFTAVPEPSTVALLALSAAGVLFFVRRSRSTIRP